MSSLASFFSPLRKAAAAFFRHDLALRRGDGGVRLVLEDRVGQPAAKAPSRAEQATAKQTRELELARQDLARVLDEHALTRSQLRQLAFIEHALQKKGWRSLYKVPLNVLQQALEQLESLVTNWSPEGLACLRSKMAVAVIDREHQDVDDSEVYRTAALLENPPALAAQAIEAAMAPAEDEDAALMAAYAALGTAAPSSLEVQGELGSPSARSRPREPQPAHADASAIRLRDLQT